MSSSLIQLICYCECVKNGNKPIAVTMVQNRYMEDAINILIDNDLYFTLRKHENWTEVYLYKYGYMNEIVENLPDNPKTPYEHWLLGKAFGYSEEEIKNFILKEN